MKSSLYGIILVVAVLTLGGMALVWRYAQLDIQRDMRNWQEKLNILANTHTASVDEWVQGHFTGLKKLAENPSLQLYFTELSMQNAQGQPMEVEPAQKTYLRNLLSFTADRLGFAPQNLPLSSQIPAQIPFEASSGIVVMDNDENIVVSTPYFTGLDPRATKKLRAQPASSAGMLDLFKNEQGKTQIGFSEPVYGIQADPITSAPIGRIVGVREITEELAAVLRQPGSTEKTLDAVLVRIEGDNIVYIASTLENAVPLERQVASTNLAEAQAVAQAGQFVVNGVDYRSRPVLATARAVPGTPWFLVMKIDRAEALAETQLRRTGMMVVLFLLIAAVAAVVVAVWYSASSRRALFTSRYFKDSAAKARAQERLLSLVANSQPGALYIVDEKEHFRFINSHAAKELGMHVEDTHGKNMNDVLGAARGDEVAAACKQALQARETVSRTWRRPDETVVQAEYVPLPHVPVAGLPEDTPGVLVVEQDITSVVQERERRLASQRQLIDTLVSIVDKRDPSAAHHSRLVASIATEVANSMGLEEGQHETARLAGSLMNIGKVAVPESVLTRPQALAEEELKSVRESISLSADLLQGVSFEGPVVETLRQVHEHWDGTGSLGLKGEAILVTARIIAAVNAFVAMISERSYRPALSMDAAFNDLMQKTGTQFDRAVVAALVNYVENHGGRAAINGLLAAK